MNSSPNNQTIDISLLDVFVDQGSSFGSGTFTLYDLWQKDSSGKWGAKVGDFKGTVSVAVNTHATRVYRAVYVSALRREL